MPTFTIQTPEGKKLKIEAPDQATALRGAEEWSAQNAGGRRKSGLSGVIDDLTEAPKAAWKNVADKYSAYSKGAEDGASRVKARSRDVGMVRASIEEMGRPSAKGPGVGDFLALAASPLAGVQHAILRPVAEGIASTGVRTYDTPSMIEGVGDMAQGRAPRAPRMMTQDESAKEIESGIGSALMGVRSTGLPSMVRVPAAAAPTTAAERGARKLGRLAQQDPVRMTQAAAEMRSAGLQPTFADVVDQSGAGVMRAAASRQTPARQAAVDFADGRATGLPGQMSDQARRVMSNDPRTPMEIAENLGQARATAAADQFGAVRGEMIDLAPETVQSLRADRGRAAIREAAARERDPEVRAALNRLSDDALDNPGGTQITVGMADRISRVLQGQAQAAAGDRDLAGMLNGLARDIRGPARAAVPGYDEALRNYEAQSRLMASAERGEDFLARNTDEFAADVGQMGPDELALARATGRRAIERAAGENISAAPGVARRIAVAPEQQARNAALLGPDDAERLQQGMALVERGVQRGRLINPESGSRTALNTADQQASQGVDLAARTGANLAHGNIPGLALDGVKLLLRRMQINDVEAEGLINLAIDPARTDEAIAYLAPRVGGNARAQAVLRNVRTAISRYAVPANDAATTVQRSREERPRMVR
jgi:hypothetical protein